MRPSALRPARLNRRNLLVGAAASLAFGLPAGAQATAPVRRLTAGAFELTIISDGHLVLPTGGLAPDASPAERAAALTAAGQTGLDFASPTNVTLIRAGTELILVDAGSGPHFMPTAGKLVENLAAAGIAPEAITQVVFTHGHPDHLWGTLDDLDELTFPNASYVVAAPEWDFWTGEDAARGLPEDRLMFVQAARRNYQRIKDKVRMVKPGEDVVSGVRVVATPGHTQGHISLDVAGDAFITGDALTHPVISFAHPRWRMAADHEPERAAATRLALLDRLAADRTRLIGFHLPYPGVGRVESRDGAYRFVAE
jgi:glyoxylase-like metal-dependent hydrolase (beta-lactamase superfamily II)